MTWAKIDDAILDNPKIIRSGPIGFALHVAAITWCARNLTDGFVPKQKAKQLLQQNWSEASADPDRMTIWELNSGSGQVGRDADETIDAVIGLLVEVGLWAEDFDDRGNFGYQLNDYCEYNPKRAEVLAERERIRATRQEAGRRGGQRSAEAKAQAGRKQTASKRQANDQASAPANAEQTSTPVPVPVPKEEEPPTPFPDEPRPPPRDPMAYLAGGTPQQRPEVVEVFKTFCEAVGQPRRRMKAAGFECPDAGAIVEALATYGLADCLAVAREAPRDGMVSGADDDKRQRHDSVRYVFGNPDTFARILRASQGRQDRASRHGGKTAAQVVAEAKALGRDS